MSALLTDGLMARVLAEPWWLQAWVVIDCIDVVRYLMGDGALGG